MAVEHKDIPDAQLHECKGVKDAPENFVQRTNGDGTATWVPASSIIDPSQFVIETVFDGFSYDDQDPSADDTIKQVSFGPAKGDLNSPVRLFADGSIEVQQEGMYRFRIILALGTDGANTNASIFYRRPLINGTPTIESIGASINPGEIREVMQEYWHYFEAGDILTYEFIRDSAGESEGGLRAMVPTDDALGFGDSPSAHVSVSRFVRRG